MACTCTNCYGTSCPEPIAVSLTQNIIEIGEGTLHPHTDTALLTGSTFILSYAPFNFAGMVVTVGGSLQVYGTDYSVSAAGVITFADGAVSGQTAIAIYNYVTGEASISAAITGDMETLAKDAPTAADVKAGYIILDGGSLMGETIGSQDGYVTTLYPALSAFLAGSLDSDTCDPLNFADTVLLSLESQDGVAVSFYRIIKT